MKKYVNMTTLPWLAAVSGAVCAGLKLLLLSSFVDEKGLVMEGALPGVLMAALAAVVAALAAAAVLRSENSCGYRENFPASIPGAVCTCALAAALALNLLTPDIREDGLANARLWLGWASVPCLLVTAYGRLKGEKPLFVFHGILCLFFGLHLVDRYRSWSGEPELVMYVFQLMTCLSLMLSAYQRTAFDVELGSRKALILCSLPAVFCFLPAAAGGEDALFYLAGGLWCLSGLHAPAAPEVADDEAA